MIWVTAFLTALALLIVFLYVEHAGKESNLQPAVLEAAALPIELPAYKIKQLIN